MITASDRRRGYGLDVLYALQHCLSAIPKSIEAGACHLYSRLLSILTGLNFVVTIHRMRAPGMTWIRLPLFIWSTTLPASSCAGTPVLAITLLLVILNGPSTSASSIRPGAAIRFCSNTCSGFIRIRPSTSWFLPAMGVVSEIILLLPQTHLRLQRHSLVQHWHCGAWLPGLGAPHVCGRHSLYAARLLALQLHGRGAFSHQGLQLDRDALQGLDQFSTRRCSMPWIYWLFTMGGLTGLFLAALARCARDRYLFHRRPFPLHHGGRRGDGLPGRDALLVAQDYGSDVPGAAGPLVAAIVFFGFNLTFFPQFILGYLGEAIRYW